MGSFFVIAVVDPIWLESRVLFFAGQDNYFSLPGGAYPARTLRQCVELIAPFLAYIPAGGRIHAGYWGPPSRANCFDPLVLTWLK